MATVNNANTDTTNIGDEVTFHATSGTSTATNIYLDIEGGAANKVHIANDKDFVVLSMNNQTFTNPRTVTAGVGFGFTSTNFSSIIRSIKIRASEATSHFEVIMW